MNKKDQYKRIISFGSAITADGYAVEHIRNSLVWVLQWLYRIAVLPQRETGADSNICGACNDFSKAYGGFKIGYLKERIWCTTGNINDSRIS